MSTQKSFEPKLRGLGPLDHSGCGFGFRAVLLLHEQTSEANARRFYRFIANRDGQDLSSSFRLLSDETSPTTPSKPKRRPTNGELHFQKSELNIVLFRSSLS